MNNCETAANANIEFAQAAQPLIDYIRAKHNSHTVVIVTATGAELLSGNMAFDVEPKD